LARRAPRTEPEHLLLATLREDRALAKRLLPSPGAYESIRTQIESHTTVRERVSTSLDIPMSAESKRVLECAAEEAPDRQEIGTAHLLLGILHLEKCFATDILRNFGLSLASVRQELQRIPASGVKEERSKPTACRDCKHLILEGEIGILNEFCGASPREPKFDCYTGEFKSEPSDPLVKRFQFCARVNSGDCRLFDQKEG
jgi:ATP-dependent Clp protease ATP-binding subunit ClpA